MCERERERKTVKGTAILKEAYMQHDTNASNTFSLMIHFIIIHKWVIYLSSLHRVSKLPTRGLYVKRIKKTWLLTPN